MGLNTNQMITRSDAQSLTRGGVFFTNLNKCVTRGECDEYKLLVTSGSRASNQLIPKTDLSLGRTFTIYYGIYNNKDSAVTLDYLRVQVAPRPFTSWTQIGSINPGTISKNSYKTGTITCTIPSSVNMADNDQALRLFCGNTLYDQQWYFCWRNSDNITNLPDYYWGTVRTENNQEITNTDRAYSWRAYFMAMTSSDAPVLNGEGTWDHLGTEKGRAALFMIK